MSSKHLKYYIARGGNLFDKLDGEWSIFTHFLLRGLRLHDNKYYQAAFSFNPSIELVRESLLVIYLFGINFEHLPGVRDYINFLFESDYSPRSQGKYFSIFHAEGELVSHDDRSWLMTPLETALYLKKITWWYKCCGGFTNEANRPYDKVVEHYLSASPDPSGFFVIPLIEMLDLDSILKFIERGADPEARGFFKKYKFHRYLIDNVLYENRGISLARKLGLGSSEDLKRYIMKDDVFKIEKAIDFGLKLDPQDLHEIIMTKKNNFRTGYYYSHERTYEKMVSQSLQGFSLQMLEDVGTYIPDILSIFFDKTVKEKINVFSAQAARGAKLIHKMLIHGYYKPGSIGYFKAFNDFYSRSVSRTEGK